MTLSDEEFHDIIQQRQRGRKSAKGDQMATVHALKTAKTTSPVVPELGSMLRRGYVPVDVREIFRCGMARSLENVVPRLCRAALQNPPDPNPYVSIGTTSSVVPFRHEYIHDPVLAAFMLDIVDEREQDLCRETVREEWDAFSEDMCCAGRSTLEHMAESSSSPPAGCWGGPGIREDYPSASVLCRKILYVLDTFKPSWIQRLLSAPSDDGTDDLFPPLHLAVSSSSSSSSSHDLDPLVDQITTVIHNRFSECVHRAKKMAETSWYGGIDTEEHRLLLLAASRELSVELDVDAHAVLSVLRVWARQSRDRILRPALSEDCRDVHFIFRVLCMKVRLTDEETEALARSVTRAFGAKNRENMTPTDTAVDAGSLSAATRSVIDIENVGLEREWCWHALRPMMQLSGFCLFSERNARAIGEMFYSVLSLAESCMSSHTGASTVYAEYAANLQHSVRCHTGTRHPPSKRTKAQQRDQEICSHVSREVMNWATRGGEPFLREWARVFNA